MRLKNIFINLITVGVSTYIPLFLFSTFVYLLENPSKSETERNMLEFLLERRKTEDIPQKVKLVQEGYTPLYHPLGTKPFALGKGIFPIGTLPLTNTFDCNEGYGVNKYKTDRFGLRNLDNKWPKASKEKTIYLIGDSYTQGNCVHNNSTIFSNIENITGINTINLADSGNGPYEYIAVMQSLMKPIIEFSNNEKLIGIIFYANDNIEPSIYDDNLLDQVSPIVYISPTGEFQPTSDYITNVKGLINDNFPIKKNEIINELKKETKKELKAGIIYQAFTLWPVRYRVKSLLKKEPLKNISYSQSPSSRSIYLLNQICKNKCNTFIAYIPNSSYWHPIPHAKPYSNNFKKELIDVSNKLGINFIDGEEVIDRNNLKDYAPKGLHLSIEGYKKISELISKRIFKK